MIKNNDKAIIALCLLIIVLSAYHLGMNHKQPRVNPSIQVESDFIDEIKAEADCWECDLCIAGY